ncbi:MAG: hypothetical protein Q4A11_04675 [Brachymonas sp.]|nr:hypothetical protein [Brachymonas sp.]
MGTMDVARHGFQLIKSRKQMFLNQVATEISNVASEQKQSASDMYGPKRIG